MAFYTIITKHVIL